MTTIQHTKIFEEMRLNGMVLPQSDRIPISVPNAKEQMQSWFNYVVGLEGKQCRWLSAYDEVAEWLTDNKGKGLYLYGNCGLGKSLLTKYIIPAIVLNAQSKIIKAYDMRQFMNSPDEVFNRKLLALDDVGTEEISVSYGTKRDLFPELMDMAEKYGKVVIASSNLDSEQLLERYGSRTMERIMATMKRVRFQGKSFRV